MAVQQFDYHQKLHHSQTKESLYIKSSWFDYHQKLHHSQTTSSIFFFVGRFDYHQKLHHSQTMLVSKSGKRLFDYHQKLHHSQTSKRVIFDGTCLFSIITRTSIAWILTYYISQRSSSMIRKTSCGNSDFCTLFSIKNSVYFLYSASLYN